MYVCSMKARLLALLKEKSFGGGNTLAAAKIKFQKQNDQTAPFFCPRLFGIIRVFVLFTLLHVCLCCLGAHFPACICAAWKNATCRLKDEKYCPEKRFVAQEERWFNSQLKLKQMIRCRSFVSSSLSHAVQFSLNLFPPGYSFDKCFTPSSFPSSNRSIICVDGLLSLSKGGFISHA